MTTWEHTLEMSSGLYVDIQYTLMRVFRLSDIMYNNYATYMIVYVV